MKKLITGLIIAASILGGVAIAHAANPIQYAPDLYPLSNSTYYFGTTTRAWTQGSFNSICLTSDTCRSTWPTGGTGSITTSTAAQTGKLAVWTGNSTLGNSILFDNGTVAGVNATTTSYTFNIQGGASVNPFNISSSTGNSVLTVTQAGAVGINTTTPSSKLHIIGDGATSATSGFEVDDSNLNTIFYIRNDNAIGFGTSTLIAGGSLITETKTNTNAASTRIMHYISFLAQPASNSSAVYQPLVVSMSTNANFNYTGSLTGLNAQVLNNNTGTASSLIGGIYIPQNASSGAVTNMTALSLTPKNTGIGTTTTATGLSVVPTVSAGSMTTFIGINVPATTQAATNYSALFGNNVGIGTTTPAYLLDVNNGNATTTIQIDNTSTSKGSCLKLKDADGSGYTYCYVNNGTMTCSTGSCE